MRKSFFFCLLIWVVILFSMLSGCAIQTGDQSSRINGQSFFVWMDGYCAAQVSSNVDITFSYYYETVNPLFKEEDIASIAFEGISEDVAVLDFQISELEIYDKTYAGFGITLTTAFNKEGIYETEGINIYLSNNNYYCFPIGNWVFDIGAGQNTDIVDTWSSPAATSNSENFAYCFILNTDEAKITSIQYGKDKSIHDVSGLEVAGVIDISDDYDAPIKYIRPKIEVAYPTSSEVVYSNMGCYCGAIGFPDGIIALSKEHTLHKLPK